MLLHQKLLTIERIDRNATSKGNPEYKEADVSLIKLLHVEHPEIYGQLYYLAEDDWPLTPIYV